MAFIFGLDPLRTVMGLPVGAYADRIHAEDRNTVAALVSKAVRDGKPYRAEYWVVDPAGISRWVMAFGGASGTTRATRNTIQELSIQPMKSMTDHR